MFLLDKENFFRNNLKKFLMMFIVILGVISYKIFQNETILFALNGVLKFWMNFYQVLFLKLLFGAIHYFKWFIILTVGLELIFISLLAWIVEESHPSWSWVKKTAHAIAIIMLVALFIGNMLILKNGIKVHQEYQSKTDLFDFSNALNVFSNIKQDYLENSNRNFKDDFNANHERQLFRFVTEIANEQLHEFFPQISHNEAFFIAKADNSIVMVSYLHQNTCQKLAMNSPKQIVNVNHTFITQEMNIKDLCVYPIQNRVIFTVMTAESYQKIMKNRNKAVSDRL